MRPKATVGIAAIACIPGWTASALPVLQQHASATVEIRSVGDTSPVRYSLDSASTYAPEYTTGMVEVTSDFDDQFATGPYAGSPMNARVGAAMDLVVSEPYGSAYAEAQRVMRFHGRSPKPVSARYSFEYLLSIEISTTRDDPSRKPSGGFFDVVAWLDFSYPDPEDPFVDVFESISIQAGYDLNLDPSEPYTKTISGVFTVPIQNWDVTLFTIAASILADTYVERAAVPAPPAFAPLAGGVTALAALRFRRRRTGRRS